MQLRLLRLSWISLLPPAERVSAGAAFFQQESSRSSWPLYAETSETEWVEAQYTKADTGGLLGDDLVTWEESSEHRASHAIVVQDEGAPEGPRPGTVGRAFRLPALFKGLGVSLGLLLCVSFLSATLMRRPPPKEQEEYDRRQEARARLEKVKALFPAAKKLALVVNSAESHALLKKVGNILTEKDLVPPETTKAERFETLLADALKALGRLHQAAIEEARVVVQADESLPELSTLGLSPEPSTDAFFRLEQQSEQQAVRPLVRTYRSLFDSALTLSKQYKDSAHRLFSQRPFEDEEDADVLVKTAASFEALRAIGGSRRRLSEVGREVGEDLIEGVKLMFLEQQNRALRDIEGELQMLRLRRSLTKNAADTGADSAAADTLTPVREQKALAALERAVEEVESLLDQVRSNAEVLRTSTTLAVAIAAGRISLDAEEKARYLLEQCDEIEASLPALPEHIDAETSILLHENAKNNVGVVRTESASVLDTLKRIRTTVDREGRWFTSLEKFVFTDLVQHARVIEKKGMQRAEHAAEVGEKLKEVKSTRSAVDLLAESGAHVVFQSLDSGRMRMLRICSHLAVFLNEEMNYIVNQAGKAESQSSSLSGHEKQEYDRLQSKYEAARRAAMDAKNLLEVAEAAGEMRECVFKMQGLLFAPSGTAN